jgi:hypothetical protein
MVVGPPRKEGVDRDIGIVSSILLGERLSMHDRLRHGAQDHAVFGFLDEQCAVACQTEPLTDIGGQAHAPGGGEPS